MALAATRIITAMATGLLATAATSFSGDGPSPEPAPQIRPYIQASSMVNLGAFATPNGLLAAAAKAQAIVQSSALKYALFGKWQWNSH